MDKLTQLAQPLVKLAEENSPDQFMKGEIIDGALFSESGLAEYIAQGLGGRLLWCEPIGWLVYDECSGTFMTGYAEDVIFELIKFYRDKIFALIKQADPQNQNAPFRFYKSLLKASTTKAVISLLKHESGVAVLPKEFNQNMDAVNCQGVVVSIDGRTRPATPEDRFTFSTMCKPEQGSPKNFMKFLKWSSSKDKELINWKLTVYGISLFGHPTDKIINLYGTGRNGKGTELRTLSGIMGEYATVLPRPLAIKEPYSSSRFDLEVLVGKRMATLFDLMPERGKLNLDVLKSVCGNGDRQSVEPKGKKRYEAVICCKIFLASNDKIPIDSFGPSEKERFYLVPFDNHIQNKDETLEDRFKPEYGKILNLLIKYAIKYYKNGRKMPACTAIDKATAAYFDSQDLVGQFIQDNCVVGKNLFVKKTELYTNFVAWCDSEQGIKQPIKSKLFTEALEKRNIHEKTLSVSDKSTRVFMGIITKLQKKHEFELHSHKQRDFNTNAETGNSCNSVMNETEDILKTDLEPYHSEKQKQLWKDTEAIIY